MSLEIPWVEKYRPRTFSDIVSQSIAINNLKKFVKSTNIPHLIFTGPAGTGKTSTALIIAKHFLKDEELDTNLLELNASDTVRIDFVRNILKNFVNQNLVKNGSLKFVILDEADNIPGQVQQALRRIIEKTSNNVKFILLCNYINRIIDPIISRCAVFRFVSLLKESIIERLKYISEEENLKIPSEKKEEFFDQLYFISGGDLRKAINTLQMAVALDLLENLDINEVFKISGFLDVETLKNLNEAIKNKDFIKSREIIQSIEAFDSRNFIRQISEILPSLNIAPVNIINLKTYIGDIDYRISQGADELIQISALLALLIENIES
ncbi:MAG: replication factor C small subunit [Candidatus Lokiarchaeota archaeon]|nr:replication factor C small subunit [Candidatus Lokiarchaeota archaeon]